MRFGLSLLVSNTQLGLDVDIGLNCICLNFVMAALIYFVNHIGIAIAL